MLFDDYTGAMYRQLVAALVVDRVTYTIRDYVRAHQPNRVAEPFVIMRHDVDGNISNALRMASIENEFGIRTTYYFRKKPGLFVPEIIRKIAQMGHEIGYHYEVLSDTRGDHRKARHLFKVNLEAFRRIAPVTTVCMHGRSFSPHNNLTLWDHYSLDEFDLIAEPYLSIDYRGMYYFTDTGLRWDNRKFNLRDVVASKTADEIDSTPKLINFLRTTGKSESLAVLTHTNNWHDNKVTWLFNKSLFGGINTVKSIRKKLTRIATASSAGA